MNKALIYLRVSTDHQADSGLGLAEQLAQAKRCLENNLKKRIPDLELLRVTPEGKHNHELTEPGVFIDPGISARNTNLLERPVGRQLLSHLGAGDLLICAYQNRSFRQHRDFTNTFHLLSQKGIKLVFADKPDLDATTASGMLILNIIAANDQYFSDSHSERLAGVNDIRRAHPHLARKLRHTIALAWKNQGIYANTHTRAKLVVFRWVLHMEAKGVSRTEQAERLAKMFQRRWKLFKHPDSPLNTARMRHWIVNALNGRGEDFLFCAARYEWFKGPAITSTWLKLMDWRKRRAKVANRANPRVDENGDWILTKREQRYASHRSRVASQLSGN